MKVIITFFIKFLKAIFIHKKSCCKIVVFYFLLGNVNAQQVVRYDLTIKDTLVNFTGKTKRAIAVNGQIPMPTLTFTETLEVHYDASYRVVRK